MHGERRLVFSVVAIAAMGLLSYWLYRRFHVVFFFLFLPLGGLGGSILAGMFGKTRGRQMKEYDEHNYTVENQDADEDADSPGDRARHIPPP
jgi:hypothetical protein